MSLKFVEYDQRAHRLNTLASFSFFVASELDPYPSPRNYITHIQQIPLRFSAIPAPRLPLSSTPRQRSESCQHNPLNPG